MHIACCCLIMLILSATFSDIKEANFTHLSIFTVIRIKSFSQVKYSLSVDHFKRRF